MKGGEIMGKKGLFLSFCLMVTAMAGTATTMGSPIWWIYEPKKPQL